MNCCLCLYAPIRSDIVTRPDVVIIDGYSLCPQHARDVVNRADYVRIYPDERLALAATVRALHPPDFNQ